uniref:Uncharacterized protein n=1 Tax=Molossus molossus TaxID=27622 RepID=A0A7J8FS78_MOLMO|nr:hypothetical protein HJG59_008374 [Molossus molossus]
MKLCYWEPEITAMAVMYLAGVFVHIGSTRMDLQTHVSERVGAVCANAPVDVLEDICHQILDVHSPGHNRCRITRLASCISPHRSPPVPPVPPSQSSQGPKPLPPSRRTRSHRPSHHHRHSKPSS